MLTGSLGMLPSASLGAENDVGKRMAMYEPVHGSAPDIAGEGKANPIATIASFGMCLRYSFDMGATADRLDAAISSVLARGLRTSDIAQGRLRNRRHHRHGRRHSGSVGVAAREARPASPQRPVPPRLCHGTLLRLMTSWPRRGCIRPA